MKLWVRSQDKEVLMIINTVALAKDEEGLILGYGIDGKIKVKLGRYATRERALEVLDEIQHIMQPKLYIETRPIESISDAVSNMYIQREKSYIEQLNTIVYQMPEE